MVWDRSPLCYETYARCYGADLLTWPLQLLARMEQPDLVILLDLDPQTSVRRVEARVEQPHQTDEGLALLVHARDTYLALAAGRDDVVVLDAGRSPEAVAEDVWRVVRTLAR